MFVIHSLESNLLTSLFTGLEAEIERTLQLKQKDILLLQKRKIKGIYVIKYSCKIG